MFNPDDGNKIPAAMSVHDNELREGTTDGPCLFTVHGLTGPEFENMSPATLKAKALQNLAENCLTLGISHNAKPQSMYDNLQAYPQMFPWLFPMVMEVLDKNINFQKSQKLPTNATFLFIMINAFKQMFIFQ